MSDQLILEIKGLRLESVAGNVIVDNVDGQDMMAWITQGAIADRTMENLGASDKGIATYRRVLRREIKKMQQGQDPIGIVRDAARNACIDLPNEKKKHHNSDGFASFMLRTHAKYSPIAQDLVNVFENPRIREATEAALEAQHG